MRQHDLSPAPSSAAYPLKAAARIACATSLLLSAFLFAFAWEEQYRTGREHFNAQAEAETKAVAKALSRYDSALKGLATLVMEQPQSPLAWRSYVNELERKNALPGMREIGLVQSLALIYSPPPVAGSQPDSARSPEISNAIEHIPNGRVFSFSIFEEEDGQYLQDVQNATSIYPLSSRHTQNSRHGSQMLAILAVSGMPANSEQPGPGNTRYVVYAQFSPDALVNAAPANNAMTSVHMQWREVTGTEATIPLYRRFAISHSGRNADDRFRKSALFRFNGHPWTLEIAASHPARVDTTKSRWLFYFSGIAFLFGIALLGAICVSISKRASARRRISDTYLKRARAIARFGSYKIQVSKDLLHESNRWSEEMYCILRREPAQGPMRIAAYVAQYVHPEDRSFAHSIFEKAVTGNSVAEGEYRIILPEGKIRYVHDVLEYVSSHGNKKVLLGQIHDVTERHRMQEELDRTRAELKRSIAAMESLRGEERKRVAQEMHDDLGQLLAAMKMDLDDLGQSTSLGDKMRQRLDVLNGLVSAMIVSVRRIVADLPPKELEDLGLFKALSLMKQNFQNRHRLPCHLELPQELPSLDRKIASTIYRTIQESLSNIAKHANATHVVVELTVDSGYITVRVTDDGKGLSPDAFQKTDSFGLTGMRERTTALNGNMILESREDSGTVVQVRLPTDHA
jgi:signal transduction histidine kinase